MKTIINTEATRYDYGMDGLREYLWDGKLSNEEIQDKADEVMSTVINILWHNGWEWDASSGDLEYDDEDFMTSEDAVEQFLEDKETYIEMVVHNAEKAAENSDTSILKGYPILSENYLRTRVLANAVNRCTDEDVKRLMNAVCFEVSNLLPCNMYWVPDIGKVMSKAGQTLSIKEFAEIYDKAFDKVF